MKRVQNEGKKGATLVELVVVMLLTTLIAGMAVTLFVLIDHKVDESSGSTDVLTEFSFLETDLKGWIRHYDNYDYQFLNVVDCDEEGNFKKDGTDYRVTQKSEGGDLLYRVDTTLNQAILQVQFQSENCVERMPNGKTKPMKDHIDFYFDREAGCIRGEIYTILTDGEGKPLLTGDNKYQLLHDPDKDYVVTTKDVVDMRFFLQRSENSGHILVNCIVTYMVDAVPDTIELKFATHARSAFERKASQGKVVG